jgi:glucokinase
MSASGATQLEIAITIDVGGSKVAAATVDRRGHLEHRTQVATSSESAQAVIDQIVYLAKEQRAAAEQRVVGVGVAVPGAVDPMTGFVRWAPNLPGWRDIPLSALLQEALDLPVCVGYDGHMAALGECWRGAGRGARNVVCLVIGTGIGGGIILDGRLYHGGNNIAGAAGWMVAANSSPPNSSQGRAVGWLESQVAGPGAAAAVERALKAGSPSSLDGQLLTGAAVFAAAEAGDSLARQIVAEAARNLGLAVVDIVSLLDPDIVILGGGVGSAVPAYLDATRAAVASYAQPISARSVRIERAMLGNDANLVGAAQLVFKRRHSRA